MSEPHLRCEMGFEDGICLGMGVRVPDELRVTDQMGRLAIWLLRFSKRALFKIPFFFR